MSVAIARRLDDASSRAVPAAKLKEIDGWLARRTPGLSTKRANSVLARDDGGGELQERIERCEQFYAEAGLRARFQVTPASAPAALSTVLFAQGYVSEAPTVVGTCALTSELRWPGAGELEVEIASGPSPEWWRTWQTALVIEPDRMRAVASVFQRMTQDAAFAVISTSSRPIAVGLGVLDRDWVGIFNMATVPEHRGQGAALTALQALTAWALHHGASNAYLQVDSGNAPARRLYKRAGFRDLYRYQYLAQT